MTALLDPPAVADPCTCHADAVERATPTPARSTFPALSPVHTPPPARKPKMQPAPSAAGAPSPLVASLNLAAVVLSAGGAFNLQSRVSDYEVIIRPVGTGTASDAPAFTTVADVPRDELFAVLFSADEKSIIRGVLGHEPTKAKEVMDRCRGFVESSKFWVLWSNLQHRQIIGDAEEGDGFVILPAWVRELAASFDPQKARR